MAKMEFNTGIETSSVEAAPWSIVRVNIFLAIDSVLPMTVRPAESSRANAKHINLSRKSWEVGATCVQFRLGTHARARDDSAGLTVIEAQSRSPEKC